MRLTDRREAMAGALRLGAELSAWLRAARNWSMQLLGKTALGASKDHACATTIEQVIADLNRLNHSTEQDFLKLGGKLADLIEAVSLISSEFTALSSLISGEHGLRTSQALTGALEHSTELGARSEAGRLRLAGMREEADRLKRTLAGFAGTVSTFRTLGVLTRIETVRLGSAGADFGSLADDVQSLSGDIQARVENALNTAALLIPPIESALRNASALNKGQVKDLPALIPQVLASLSTFHDIQQRSRDAAARLSAQYDAISADFNELIVSLQFHDITRQQVEHVTEALRRLGSESEEERGGGQDRAAVIALQASQLADAAEKFASSVASIAQSLDDIATRVLQMAQESRTLSGVSADEKDSFFVQMEQGCGGILTSLGLCAKAESATRITSGSLSQTIAKMQKSAEEIQEIEIQMQRMGLNASIRAGHIGAPGDALSVLAGTMQQLASDARQRAETLVEALGAMSEAAVGLSALPTTDSADQDGYLERVRTTVAELHLSSERSFNQIAQIVACGTRLHEDLSTARTSFTVGAVFAEAISRATGMLNQAAEESRADSWHDVAASSTPALADFERHYTMQAERDVHEGIAKSAAGAMPEGAQPELHEPPNEEAEEIAKSVEFF